jgi:hypothetical protein
LYYCYKKQNYTTTTQQEEKRATTRLLHRTPIENPALISYMKQLKYVILSTVLVGIRNAGTAAASHLDKFHGLRSSMAEQHRERGDGE